MVCKKEDTEDPVKETEASGRRRVAQSILEAKSGVRSRVCVCVWGGS